MTMFITLLILSAIQEVPRTVEPTEVLKIATETLNHINTEITNYTGILVKREYVDGRDTGYQYLYFKFRKDPIGIYIKFLKPKSVEGREVLYLGGDELTVKRGGRRNPGLTLTLLINSPLVTDGNRYSIQEMGLQSLSKQLLERMQTEIVIPDTEIKVYDNAKLDGVPVTHYRLIHRTKTPETTCRTAEISIDKKLNIPVYYRALSWDDPPVVIEEYGFRDLDLNPKFTDSDFSLKNPEYGFQNRD